MVMERSQWPRLRGRVGDKRVTVIFKRECRPARQSRHLDAPAERQLSDFCFSTFLFIHCFVAIDLKLPVHIEDAHCSAIFKPTRYANRPRANQPRMPRTAPAVGGRRMPVMLGYCAGRSLRELDVCFPESCSARSSSQDALSLMPPRKWCQSVLELFYGQKEAVGWLSHPNS